MHSEVHGPMPTLSMGGSAYFVTFIDDATMKVWAYPMVCKSDALNVFQNGVAERMNQTVQERMQCMLSHASLLGGF